MDLVPGVQETVLRQIVGERVVSRQPTQETPDLGLMSPNQLAERSRILPCDDPGNEYVILDPACVVLQGFALPSVTKVMQQQPRQTQQKRKHRGRSHDSEEVLLGEDITEKHQSQRYADT